MNCVICCKPIYDRPCRGAHQACYHWARRTGNDAALLPAGKPGPKPRPRDTRLGDLEAQLAAGFVTLRQAARSYGVTPAEMKRLLYAPKHPNQQRDRAGAARALVEAVRRG